MMNNGFLQQRVSPTLFLTHDEQRALFLTHDEQRVDDVVGTYFNILHFPKDFGKENT